MQPGCDNQGGIVCGMQWTNLYFDYQTLPDIHILSQGVAIGGAVFSVLTGQLVATNNACQLYRPIWEGGGIMEAALGYGVWAQVNPATAPLNPHAPCSLTGGTSPDVGVQMWANSWGGTPTASSATVSYTSVDTALPEPSSLALLGTALLIVTLTKARGRAWAWR